MKKLLTTITLLLLTAAAAKSQTSDVKVPAEVQPFVEKGATAIAVESGDLNRDGQKDYILVFERPIKDGEDTMQAGQRPLLILIRDADGSLSEAKRNEDMVYCAACGGVFGDPFEGITVGPGTFTVSHYGGSNWRWANNAKFNYSRIDKTWQLVRYESSTFHTSKPNAAKTKVFTPKQFGKVDIADFDASKFDN